MMGTHADLMSVAWQSEPGSPSQLVEAFWALLLTIIFLLRTILAFSASILIRLSMFECPCHILCHSDIPESRSPVKKASKTGSRVATSEAPAAASFLETARATSKEEIGEKKEQDSGRLVEPRLSPEDPEHSTQADKPRWRNDEVSGSCVDDILVLRRALETERAIGEALRQELEEEQEAAHSAAMASMAMIQKLQEEKAVSRMEATQKARIGWEKAKYDEEAIKLMKMIIEKQREELSSLKKEVGICRRKLLALSFSARPLNFSTTLDGRPLVTTLSLEQPVGSKDLELNLLLPSAASAEDADMATSSKSFPGDEPGLGAAAESGQEALQEKAELSLVLPGAAVARGDAGSCHGGVPNFDMALIASELKSEQMIAFGEHGVATFAPALKDRILSLEDMRGLEATSAALASDELSCGEDSGIFGSLAKQDCHPRTILRPDAMAGIEGDFSLERFSVYGGRAWSQWMQRPAESPSPLAESDSTGGHIKGDDSAGGVLSQLEQNGSDIREEKVWKNLDVPVSTKEDSTAGAAFANDGSRVKQEEKSDRGLHWEGERVDNEQLASLQDVSKLLKVKVVPGNGGKMGPTRAQAPVSTGAGDRDMVRGRATKQKTTMPSGQNKEAMALSPDVGFQGSPAMVVGGVVEVKEAEEGPTGGETDIRTEAQEATAISLKEEKARASGHNVSCTSQMAATIGPAAESRVEKTMIGGSEPRGKAEERHLHKPSIHLKSTLQEGNEPLLRHTEPPWRMYATSGEPMGTVSSVSYMSAEGPVDDAGPFSGAGSSSASGPSPDAGLAHDADMCSDAGSSTNAPTVAKRATVGLNRAVAIQVGQKPETDSVSSLQRDRFAQKRAQPITEMALLQDTNTQGEFLTESATAEDKFTGLEGEEVPWKKPEEKFPREIGTQSILPIVQKFETQARKFDNGRADAAGKSSPGAFSSKPVMGRDRNDSASGADAREKPISGPKASGSRWASDSVNVIRRSSQDRGWVGTRFRDQLRAAGSTLEHGSRQHWREMGKDSDDQEIEAQSRESVEAWEGSFFTGRNLGGPGVSLAETGDMVGTIARPEQQAAAEREGGNEGPGPTDELPNERVPAVIPSDDKPQLKRSSRAESKTWSSSVSLIKGTPSAMPQSDKGGEGMNKSSPSFDSKPDTAKGCMSRFSSSTRSPLKSLLLEQANELPARRGEGSSEKSSRQSQGSEQGSGAEMCKYPMVRWASSDQENKPFNMSAKDHTNASQSEDNSDGPGEVNLEPLEGSENAVSNSGRMMMHHRQSIRPSTSMEERDLSKLALELEISELTDQLRGVELEREIITRSFEDTSGVLGRERKEGTGGIPLQQTKGEGSVGLEKDGGVESQASMPG